MAISRLHHEPTTDVETDPLFDVSDDALAVRFGRRTRDLIRSGGDPKATARLAFSYAARALTASHVRVRQSYEGRRQHAIVAMQERFDVFLVLAVTGRLSNTRIEAQAVDAVDAVNAIMKGSVHE